MKKMTAIIATTHVDRHGDMMAPEALKSMIEQINTQYIPVGVEHDPRIPPHGRLVSAELVNLQDGELGIQGEMEMFEPGDVIEYKNDGRVIPLPKTDQPRLSIVYDRSFSDENSQKMITEASSILGSNPAMQMKKAVEPVSILILTGVFIAGGIAKGFLNKIGSDAAALFIQKIKAILKRSSRPSEQLFCFQAYLDAGSMIEVEVIMTNPSDEDIDDFMTYGLEKLDQIVPKYLNTDMSLRRMVLEFKRKELILIFGVRDDAVPLFPNFTLQKDK